MDQTTKTILIIAGVVAGAILLGFVLTQTSVAEIVPTPAPIMPSASTVTPIPTATYRSTFTPPATFTSVPPITPVPSNTTQPSPTTSPQPSPTTQPQNTVPPPTATNAQPTANPILGVLWQWESVSNQSSGQTTPVPNPEQYTITFMANGTVTGKADCNSFSGIYSQQNGFSIRITTSTSAICGTGSLDQQYLQLLTSVASGGPDGAGDLVLETAGGAQQMTFQNGGPAQ